MDLGQQSLLSSCPLTLELSPQTHQRLYSTDLTTFKKLTKSHLFKTAFNAEFPLSLLFAF